MAAIRTRMVVFCFVIVVAAFVVVAVVVVVVVVVVVAVVGCCCRCSLLSLQRVKLTDQREAKHYCTLIWFL